MWFGKIRYFMSGDFFSAFITGCKSKKCDPTCTILLSWFAELLFSAHTLIQHHICVSFKQKMQLHAVFCVCIIYFLLTLT